MIQNWLVDECVCQVFGYIEDMVQGVMVQENEICNVFIIVQDMCVSMEDVVEWVREQFVWVSQEIQSICDVINCFVEGIWVVNDCIEEISKIVFVINDIVVQINLLVFNVVIEVVWVGDLGWGFVVVVDEVC